MYSTAERQVTSHISFHATPQDSCSAQLKSRSTRVFEVKMFGINVTRGSQVHYKLVCSAKKWLKLPVYLYHLAMTVKSIHTTSVQISVHVYKMIIVGYFYSFQDVQERCLAEERSTMAHDRLRRALDVNADSLGLINGSLFIDAGCILIYSKGFVFKHKNVSYDIFNKTGLGYTVTSECKENTTHRLDCDCFDFIVTVFVFDRFSGTDIHKFLSFDMLPYDIPVLEFFPKYFCFYHTNCKPINPHPSQRYLANYVL